MEVFSPQVSGMGHREKGTQVGHGVGQDAGGMGHKMGLQEEQKI